MNDPSKYVQKSVANHINDITKEDKELVFQWLQQLRDPHVYEGERNSRNAYYYVICKNARYG